MIESYQELKALEPAQGPDIQLATVVAIYDEGITLLLDGEIVPSSKKYKYNKSVTFRSGQRVKVCRVSRSYIVEYPID